MRKSFRPRVRVRRERRRFLRRERDEEPNEHDAILDLGGDDKEAAGGGASA